MYILDIETIIKSSVAIVSAAKHKNALLQKFVTERQIRSKQERML